MRKLLVKHFVLDYKVNLFGREYTAPRASRIIYPVMFFTGLQVAMLENYPTPTTLLWISYFISAVCVFFGFAYFRIKPAKWEELDDNQKRQYGYFQGANMNNQQHAEWVKLIKQDNK
jgi:hypothetical protein